MTNPLYDNIDDLLVKVVLGEASAEETRRVEDWLSLDPVNTRYFEDFRRIWEESRNLAIRSTVNEEDAWQNFQQKVKEGEAGGGRDGRIAVLKFPLLRAAAILLLLIGAGWLYYTYSYQPAQFASIHSGPDVLKDTLSEGTVITLNRQSSIRYKKKWTEASRNVEMEGEAFFKVAPDKERPFIVQAGGAAIRVIGTSFNVRATADSIEVIVETGMVEVEKEGRRIAVRAHEKMVMGLHGSLPVKEDNRDELYNYYRTHAFTCNGTPLGRLVDKLNEVYGVHIVIKEEELRHLPLTTTFQDESLDPILDIISRTLKIKYTKSEKGVNGQEILLSKN